MNDTDGDRSRDSLDDPRDESGDDEDQTAKFGVGKRKPTVSTASASSNDTVSALDRVKNLAKRNSEVRSFSESRGCHLTPFFVPRHSRHSRKSVGCG